MKNFRKLLLIAIPVMVLMVLSSCGKKNDPSPSGYPKTVEIEYRLTKVSGDNIGLVDISYNNETGADTRLEDQTLPFTKKITKKVSYGEGFLLGITGDVRVNASIKLEIYVDGKLVKTETPVFGNAYINASIVYQFQ